MQIHWIVGFILLFTSSWVGADRLLDAMPRTMVAKNFTLPYPTGGELSLNELKGSFVLVNFWSTKCTICRAELSVLGLNNMLE